MADKTIWEYPTLMTAQPDDLILMASDEETYNMKVQTLKDAMGEAASKPPIVRNGNWWTWSAYVEDYVDSGTAATGPQGVKGDTGDTGPQGPQGVKGDTGSAAGFGTVSATVDNNTGTPSVNITTSGSDTAKNIQFAFHNMKGETGTVTPEVQALANAAAQSAASASSSADRAEAAASTIDIATMQEVETFFDI